MDEYIWLRITNERENGKEGKETREIILARWGDRVLAWLIDFILVSIALAVLFSE
jgi:hypothetical protein